MNTEALSYSRTKGLFAGIAVDGAEIQQDNDSTVAFYGKNVSFRKTLSGGVNPGEQRLVSRGGKGCRPEGEPARDRRKQIIESSGVPVKLRHAGD